MYAYKKEKESRSLAKIKDWKRFNQILVAPEKANQTNYLLLGSNHKIRQRKKNNSTPNFMWKIQIGKNHGTARIGEFSLCRDGVQN